MPLLHLPRWQLWRHVYHQLTVAVGSSASNANSIAAKLHAVPPVRRRTPPMP
jgi:hypothetical protein